MKTLIAITLFSFVLAAYGVPSATLSYVFTTIDDPAADTVLGERTEATGINASGQIVGNFGENPRHGFLYSHGVFTTFDVPGAHNTLPAGINSAGQIVGNFDDATGSHGFLFSGGAFTKIDAPGVNPNFHAATRANGINAAGQIVGDFDVLTQTTASTHAYVYSNGVLTVFDFPGAYSTQAFGIYDAGEIVGIMAFPGVGCDSGYLYNRGTFTTLNDPDAVPQGGPGTGIVTAPIAINNAGQIVGFFTVVGAWRGFLYDHGAYTTLDSPPGTDNETFPLGINNSGKIVGIFNGIINGFGGHHGFLGIPTRR